MSALDVGTGRAVALLWIYIVGFSGAACRTAMTPLSITVVCFILFPIASLMYVYRFRGEQRFTGPVEYFRKGWPIFAPLNVLLYGFSAKRAKDPILDLADYPELQVLQDNWSTLQQEVLGLYNNGYFESTTDKNNQSYYDVGFRTFYKYGWSKFYCKWYGTVHNSARQHCPRTVALLEDIDSVNGAMFTLLPPGSKLTRHLDPIACSLRYHLGLSTPNDDRCFISIDGNVHSWRDGEALLFDETYLHFARNDTDTPRFILMCDVERPMNVFGRGFNFLYKKILSMMLVPNLAGDKAGLFSRVFHSVSPILAKGKALKKTNRSMYLAIKWSLNTLIMLALLAVVVTIATALIALIRGLL
jgi:beta-hydroxylase